MRSCLGPRGPDSELRPPAPGGKQLWCAAIFSEMLVTVPRCPALACRSSSEPRSLPRCRRNLSTLMLDLNLHALRQALPSRHRFRALRHRSREGPSRHLQCVGTGSCCSSVGQDREGLRLAPRSGAFLWSDRNSSRKCSTETRCRQLSCFFCMEDATTCKRCFLFWAGWQSDMP